MLEVRGSAKLRFRLLGEASLDGESGIVRVSSQKGFALLAYLAMNTGRAQGRTVIADLLWGDRGEASARQNLRQAIHTLRRDLGPMHAGVLQTDDQSILLCGDTEVDALQFKILAQDKHPSVRERCLDIPWGPFLAGFSVGSEAFDEWVVAERHRLEAIATRTFSDLATHFDAEGDGDRAILSLERLIAIDPGEEERHRRLLMLEARYRGSDAALARGKELAAMLRREVDVECEPATSALIEDIRRKADEIRSADIDCQQEAPSTKPPVAQNCAPAPPITDYVAGDAGASASVAQAPHGAGIEQASIRYNLTVGRLAIVALMLMAVAVPSWVRLDDLLRSNRNTAPHQTTATPQASDPWKSPPLPSGRTAGSEQSNGVLPIIVMPFTTYDDAGSTRLLADMITDDVTNQLSRLRYFRVISRQTARSYHRQQGDIAAKVAELGVRYILEGSIRMHSDKLRVIVELTDTTSRTVAWSSRFERADSDRHGVQDEIVGRLVRELQIGSFEIESTRLSKDAGADALAYRGMAALQAAFSNISLEAYQRAESLFLQALERDPQNLMARLGLGSYHANVAVQRLVPDSDSHLNKALELITDVIRQKPTISGAHHQLGIILQGSGKLKEAIKVFERAIEINPSLAGAYAHIGFALARMGRPGEGLEHIRYAMRLSPMDPSLAIWLEFAGSAELELDHHQAAIENYRRSIASSPAYPRPWAGLVAAQALAGRLDEARISVDKLRALAPNLNDEQLYRRFGRLSVKSVRLQEGLRLALNLPPN